MKKHFSQHTLESAPESSKPVLIELQEKYKMIPNIAAVMAQSPVLLKLYLHGSALMEQEATLSSSELALIYLAISAENNCKYCVAAHSAMAPMSGLDSSTVADLRNGVALSDSKLESLRHFAVRVNNSRGFVTNEELEAFLAAGFAPIHVLEIIAAIALKTITNFTNHIVETNLDDAFKSQQWTKFA